MNFLHTMFLAGAVLALVPIIIHLLHRHRMKQVVFGSVRFLRKISQRVIHRRRLEEFLIILVRALALAILAAAFARPFLWKPIDRGGAKKALDEEALLVLVDNSYSMRAEKGLEKAKKEALDILRNASPITRVGVAEFSSQFQLLCPVGSTLAQAEDAVNKITQSSRGTDLAGALEQADRVLAPREEQYRQFVVVSDFRQSSWKEREDWKLSRGVEMDIKNVTEKTVPNVLVERVVVPRLVVAGGFVEVISARIRNLTDKPLQNAQAVFRIGDKVLEKKRVNIPPGSDTPVRFRHAFTEPGDVAGTVAIEADEKELVAKADAETAREKDKEKQKEKDQAKEQDKDKEKNKEKDKDKEKEKKDKGGFFKKTETDVLDKMPQDNTACFSVQVTPRVRVLIVNGDQNASLVRNDAFFLKAALAPETEGVVSPFEIKEIAPGEMKPDNLKSIDVVIFANVEQVPQENMGPLKEFILKGGGAAFLCGSLTNPEVFNKSFGDVAPCKLLKTAMQKEDMPVVINLIDMGHEIFQPFASPHTGDFGIPQFTQYFLVKDSQAARVLARFSSGHPALFERIMEKGKTILFPSALDLEWNNLCLKSVFVPFVHQLARRLCTKQAGSVRNVTVGEQVVFRVPADTESVEMRSPAGETTRLKVRSEGDNADTVIFTPEEPGIYELTYGKNTARFAVNLDPQEPDLRPLDTKLLTSSIQRDVAGVQKKEAGAVSVVAKSSAREAVESRQKMWIYLLGSVVGLLGIEMVLAARVGKA